MRSMCIAATSSIAAGLTLIACLLYLFREEDKENPAIGRITYHYKWGRVSEILVDVDRDSRIDSRYIVLGGFGGPSPNDPPVEGWESTKCDGTFDLHLVFDPPAGSRLSSITRARMAL